MGGLGRGVGRSELTGERGTGGWAWRTGLWRAEGPQGRLCVRFLLSAALPPVLLAAQLCV